MRWLLLQAGGLVAGLAACSSSPAGPGGTPTGSDVGDPFDVPIDGVSHAQALEFADGDSLFGLVLREYDGLGPLYTRASCGACHSEGTRGPGFVQKMSVVEADGVTPSPDQSKKMH
jgi:CxxC motif-containing protein (DUF1111 family)